MLKAVNVKGSRLRQDESTISDQVAIAKIIIIGLSLIGCETKATFIFVVFFVGRQSYKEEIAYKSIT